ncbi:hypothetical protein [Gelidibacter japonicus]|nr:hypothetical protein [Gelidibacter japonicus]
MKTTLLPHKKWWSTKTAPERYALMKKHSIINITNANLRKMFNKEN